MTLPASGLITMQDINVEMGRAGGTPFTLDDADVRALAGVPSGPYSMSAFYGKSRSTVRNPLNDNLNGFGSAGTITASITYRSDGTCTKQGLGSTSNWVTPTTTGIGASYWFKYIRQSGIYPTLGGLSEGVWYQLDVQRTMGMSRTTNGYSEGQYAVYIATAASDAAIVASGTLFLSVERSV